MWDTLGNIAAVIVIVLLFELLGLPDWIGKTIRRREDVKSMQQQLDRLESRIRALESKMG